MRLTWLTWSSGGQPMQSSHIRSGELCPCCHRDVWLLPVVFSTRWMRTAQALYKLDH